MSKFALWASANGRDAVGCPGVFALDFRERVRILRRDIGSPLSSAGRRASRLFRTTEEGRYQMPTYITLASWTQKGIKNIKESPGRLDATKKAFQAAGAELKEFYLVTGKYDMIVVSEAPNDETVAKLTLAIGSSGAVRTETLRAFKEDEYRRIIAALA